MHRSYGPNNEPKFQNEESWARALGREILGVGAEKQDPQSRWATSRAISDISPETEATMRRQPLGMEGLSSTRHKPFLGLEGFSLRMKRHGWEMIHVLYVVRVRDEVGFNIEYARWNSVAASRLA